MRIISGKYAGRHLTSPGGKVRPTSEAVRDAWMELLAPELKGARVLELFAGTGAVGLEALSRGARWVDFVEHGPSSLHALKANIAALRLTKEARLFKVDAIPFVERLGGPEMPPPPDPDAEYPPVPKSPFPYDICFLDPPYGSRASARVVKHWMENNFSRVLTLETAADQELPGKPFQRVFGDTALSIYRSRWMPAPAPPAEPDAGEPAAQEPTPPSSQD